MLGYMNPVMGVNSEYQIFIGNVAPTGSEVAEGGAHTENNPTITSLRTHPDHHSLSLVLDLAISRPPWMRSAWAACLRTGYRA